MLFKVYNGRFLICEIERALKVPLENNYVCYCKPLKTSQECVDVLVQLTHLLPDLANIVFSYEDHTEDAICMWKKFTKRRNVYEFWLQLNQSQQAAIIAWYNDKPMDQVMLHPYYEYSKSETQYAQE